MKNIEANKITSGTIKANTITATDDFATGGGYIWSGYLWKRCMDKFCKDCSKRLYCLTGNKITNELANFCDRYRQGLGKIADKNPLIRTRGIY